MKNYLALTLLFFGMQSNCMEPKKQKKECKEIAKLLYALKTDPAKQIEVKYVYKTIPTDTFKFVENKEQLRGAIVSILDALRLENGKLILDLHMVRRPLYHTLLGLPAHQSVTPYTVAFTDANNQDEHEQIEPRHFEAIRNALTVHLGPTPQETYVTASWAQLKALFGQPEKEESGPVLEFIREVEPEVQVIEKIVEKTVEKIVTVRPTLLQKLTDPVTLGTAGLVGVLCWLMAKK